MPFISAPNITGPLAQHLSAVQNSTPGTPEHEAAVDALTTHLQSVAASKARTNGVTNPVNGTSNGVNKAANGAYSVSVSTAPKKNGPIINFGSKPITPVPAPAVSTSTSVTTATEPTQSKPTIINPDTSAAVATPRSATLNVTGLGALLISSSNTPVAAVTPPTEPVLSTTKPAITIEAATGTAPSGKKATKQFQAPLPTIAITNSVAPKYQTHAKLWSKAIAAAKGGQDLEIGGTPMKDIGFATVDEKGAMVKLPLASALMTPQGEAVALKQVAYTTTTPAAAANLTATAAAQPTTNGTAKQAAQSTEVPAAIIAAQSAADPMHTTPTGFVLSGAVKLFGTLDAERYIYQGTASDDGKAEMVTFVQSPLNLDDVFQGSGVSLGNLKLNRPSISYYDAPSSTGREKGLWLDAGITLTDVAPDVSADAQSLFTQDPANELAIVIGLGGYSGWSAALKTPPNLTVKISLPNGTGTLGKYIQFTSASLTLVATKPTAPATGVKPAYSWDVTFGGQLLFSAPGSVAPLHLDYTMKKNGSSYDLDMKLTQDEEWTDALGVHGMNVTNVQLTASYDKTVTDKSMEFALNAFIKTGGTKDVEIVGTYKDEDFNLTAELDGYMWTDFDALFHKMFGSPLQKIKQNVSFPMLKLLVDSKDREVKLQGEITVDDWVKGIASAEIEVSSKGFQINAKVPSVTFLELTIDNAALDIFVGKQGDVEPDPKTPGTPTHFNIGGTILFHGVKLDAAAYLDKDDKGALLWAVYAKLSPEDPAKPPSFKLSNVFGLGKRSDLDLELVNFAVIASNSDALGELMPQNLDYKVQQGMQLCARVDCPSAISKVLNSKPASLELRADLSKAHKMVELVFDSPPKLSPKPGMESAGLDIGINFSEEDNPKLFIKGTLDVQFEDQPGPTEFELELTADTTEATLIGSMNTDWVGPFGTSTKVKVIAPVSLEIDIVYVSPVYPSGVGFQGSLMVGDAKGSAAFKVTTSPKEGVLLVTVQNLGIKDIISFASLIIDHKIPQPSSDFFVLEDFELGISTGASIGDTFYPKGLTYKAKMDIFGKQAQVDCEITTDEMHVSGEIDSFSLGPVNVTGNTGKNPTIDLLVSEKSQHLSVDGNIRLWELDAGVTVDAGLEPLDLSFTTVLAFADVLNFNLTATIDKIDSLKDLSKGEFIFSASLEQHILDYFMAHANTYILAAKSAADEGVENVQKKLVDAEQSYNDYIKAQQAKLNAAELAWNRQNQAVNAAANAKKTQIKAQTASKQAAVDAAKAKFDALIQGLVKKLAASKATQATEVAKAQKAVNDEKARVDVDVNDKVQKLQQAQAALSRSFGSADNALNIARAKVAAAQNDLNGVQQKLSSAKSDLSHANIFHKIKYAAEVTAYGIELGTKEAAFKVAQGVLAVAEDVVNGVGYKVAHEAVTLAQGALDDAKKAADAALVTVNKGLADTTKIQAALVDDADKALSAAQKDCDESKVWGAAKAVLAAAISVEASVVADADKMVAALALCAEKVAYDAAVAALALAKAGTKEVDLANHALTLVKDGVDEVSALGTWMVDHAGNIFNIRVVQLSGALGDAVAKPPQPLKAHIEGEFADASVKLDVSFTPGKAEDMMKQAFEQIMKEVKGNIASFVKAEIKKL